MEEKAVEAGKRKKIAVDVAGPAGLAFSTTASRQGHDVTLLKCQTKLVVNLIWQNNSWKRRVSRDIRYFQRRIEKDGVRLQLGTAVDADDLDDYDTVVVCTGVTPRALEIPELEHHVLSYVDLL